MQNGNKAKDTFSFRIQNFRKKQSVFRLKPKQAFFSAARCREELLNRQPEKTIRQQRQSLNALPLLYFLLALLIVTYKRAQGLTTSFCPG